MKAKDIEPCCFCKAPIKEKDARFAVRISHGLMHAACYATHRDRIDAGYQLAIAEGRAPQPPTVLTFRLINT